MNITQTKMFHTDKLDLSKKNNSLKDVLSQRCSNFLSERRNVTKFPEAPSGRIGDPFIIYMKNRHLQAQTQREKGKSMKLALLREKVSMAASSS